MRGGYTNIPDDLIEKHGWVGAGIAAFIKRCEAMDMMTGPSVRFIANHFKISTKTVQRHLHLIRGTKVQQRDKTTTLMTRTKLQQKEDKTTTLGVDKTTTNKYPSMTTTTVETPDGPLFKEESSQLASLVKSDSDVGATESTRERPTDPSKCNGKRLLSYDESQAILKSGGSVRLSQIPVHKRG